MQHASHGRAVFVDPSGRRHRLVARACWALGALVAAYVALVLASLVASPALGRLEVPGLGPVLPGPAAAPLGAAQGRSEQPARLLVPSPSASPSASPALGARPTPAPSRTRAALATPATSPTGTPTAAPTRTPGQPTAVATRRPTTAPTAPPGQASRTPKPRPTPTRGPR